jgi:tRNA A-37 threonylcarbamoyl transferase component Bud32
LGGFVVMGSVRRMAMLPDKAVSDDLEKRLRRACAELARRLRGGENCHAEDFLAILPSAVSEGESALELIYAEFVVREELGQRPLTADWYARFPHWRDRLQRLFELHVLLPDSAAAAALSRATAPIPPDAEPGSCIARGERWQDHYELLQKVGQGAMGVVYKARQIGLNRIVALKMIRGGEDAAAEDLARFRREAEAAARLRHPHIVTVYGIGESDGQPFFSLEFAEGGSLAQRVAGTPQPARQAAQWVECLAGAMDYAHRQGVIHRDLKPGNVVLTAEGMPKITDFGLARRLGGQAGHPESGGVAGTPSYMAPEQAAGRTKEIGPLADVYALGAILYELLTGRPPFRAETTLETLRHVQEREPERPRAINPQADRGLEAICLKCLRKEPHRRYRSAAALADDLKRWLAGEPTTACSEGWLERLWRAPRRLGARTMAMVGFLVGSAAILTVVALVVLLSSTSHPGAEDVEAERRLQRWQDIQSNLVAGNGVTLIGQTGNPPVYRWRTGGDTGKVAAAADGTFSIESWDLGLLELLPDPKSPHYRFSAEVRHDQAKPWGRTGLYFAHSTWDTPQGVEHSCFGLTFNDLTDLSKFPQKENYLELSVERYPIREARRRVFQAAMTPVAAIPNANPWRKIAVEVTRDEVSVFWEGNNLTKVPREELTKRTAWLLADEPSEVKPEFTSRRPLGLYVSRGAASFRQVTVEPLREGN